MGTLNVALLGAMQVTRSGGASVTFEADAARALLAYLVITVERATPREVLAGLLWPESSDSEARRNLRAALFRLRNATGDREADPPYLLISRSELQLNVDSDVWVDVHAFDEHLAAVRLHDHPEDKVCSACVEHLTAAGKLYRGDFMAGFSYPSAEFEGWLVNQRESCHVQVLDVLEKLAAHHEGQGAYGQSLGYARRQIELEPWRESAHRQAMRALVLSGQRAPALAQYERCAEILDEELGIEPEAATRELYEQVRRGELSPPVSPQAIPSAAYSLRHEPSSILAQAGISGQPVILGRHLPSSSLTPSEPPAPRIEGMVTGSGPLPGGERRTVTFLSVGTGGIGGDAVGVALESLAETLHEIFELTRAVATRYGGTVVQTGDAGLVAAFGAEVAHEDDVQRAVLAALEIGAALGSASEHAATEDGSVRLSYDIAVTTGDAVILAKELGGVTVHAAVLQQVRDVREHVTPGSVWVTQATYRHVVRRFVWESLGEVLVGGRDAVRLYRPTAPVVAPAEHEVQGLRVPLIGRRMELGALTDAIARVKAGIGGIVTLVGEAGIGKSRLVAEARSWAMDGRSAVDDTTDSGKSPQTSGNGQSIRWVEGRWLSYTEGTAYYGWQELLRRLLALPAACNLTACAALEEQVRDLCPEQAEAITPYLTRLLSLPEDLETTTALNRLVAAGVFQNAMFQAVTDVLLCAARGAPLLIVLEDLHWAEGASLALLESLLALTDRVPLLVLMSMRLVRSHGSWRVRETVMRDYRHRHTDLALDPLAPSESGELVRRFLWEAGGAREADADLVRQVQQRAEGNPFFAAEIVRSLIDRETEADVLPPTLEGVLTARIDRLPLEARHVLQLAAVAGRIFSYRLLLDIISGEDLRSEDGTLDEALLQLVREQLIREYSGAPWLMADQAPDRMFIFEHQLTLEAAYGSLLQRKRRALHRRVAEAWERLYPEQIPAQLSFLAYHWELAGDLERAVHYLKRAGEQAASQYANDEAEHHFGKALELLPESDLDQRYDLLLSREQIRFLKGSREEATYDLDALEELANTLGSRHKQAEVALRRARHFRKIGYPAAARAEAEMAVGIAQEMGDARVEAMGLLLASSGEGERQFLEEELDSLWRAVEIARGVGASDIEGLALREYGLTMIWLGQAEKAQAILLQALRVFRDIGDVLGEANVLDALALGRLHAGEYREARELVIQGLALQQEVGNRYDEGYAYHTFAWASYLLGEYDEAISAAASSLEALEEVGAPHGIVYAFALRGKILTGLGSYDGARTAYQEVLDRFSRDLRGYPELQAWAGLTYVHYLLGEADRAVEYGAILEDEIRRSVEVRGWYPWLRAWVQLVVGHIRSAEGAYGAARASYERALAGITAPGVVVAVRPNLVMDVRAGLAAAELEGGDLEQAVLHVRSFVDRLLAGDIDGVLEPMRVYLATYRVLQAAGDARADQVLAAGYRVLQKRAATIADEAMRASYLGNVVVNREILAVYERAKRPARSA